MLTVPRNESTSENDDACTSACTTPVTDRLVGSHEIGDHLPAQLARRRTDVDGCVELIERPFRFHVDGWPQANACERRNDPPKLGKRQGIGRGLHVERRSRQVVPHRAVDPDRGLARSKHQLTDVDLVVPYGHAPGHVVDGNRRIRPAQGNVGDLDAVVHRLVFEGQTRIDVVETCWKHNAVCGQRLLGDDRSGRHVDGIDRKWPARAAAVGLAFVLLDEPRDRPGLAVAPQIHDRVVEANRLNGNALAEELERVVAKADVFDRHNRPAVQGDAHVLELDAEEQVPAEASDGQFAIEILVCFPGDVASQPVLEPYRLRRGDPDNDDADEQHGRNDQRLDETFGAHG
jgi:hypothetical protein